MPQLLRHLGVLALLSSAATAFLAGAPSRSSSFECIHAVVKPRCRAAGAIPRQSTSTARRASDAGENDALAKVLLSDAPKRRIEGATTGTGSSFEGRRPSRQDFRGRQQQPVDPNRPVMNAELVRTVPEVRCVVSNPEEGDEMLGVMPSSEAFSKAKDLGLDLIMISETAVPPVVKIIDYGKYKYSQEKKKKEQKKKAKTTEVKEVKMSYKIEQHDYGVRMKQMTKFLEEGDKVKVVVQFRGREQQHIDLGQELLQKLSLELKEIALQEGDIRREGNRLTGMWKPKKSQ